MRAAWPFWSSVRNEDGRKRTWKLLLGEAYDGMKKNKHDHLIGDGVPNPSTGIHASIPYSQLKSGWGETKVLSDPPSLLQPCVLDLVKICGRGCRVRVEGQGCLR